ncbi:hypothetical protein TNIN_379171 [Trichonephila inaurata madagascariensis]|uniref:Uncharacterized protein n=1 Tax=Trichonephila inaurata madagascariensis TaxID=2747483 RepID=A0A8X6K4R3_9ARAC|nr:hypothetical protein TNIN_379171 [Trichonephila inaurata madagascariensis]
MANYAMYPKPRKGTPTTMKNNYTSVVNSIIRPNVSYAQDTTNNTSNTYNRQQMAPQGKGNLAIKAPTGQPRFHTQVNVNPS